MWTVQCTVYTVSTTGLFFAISHLAIIMKSDHHQKQPSSTATLHISTVHYAKECWVAKLVMQNVNFSRNCTKSNLLQLICLTFFLLQFTFNIPSPSSNLLQCDHWQTDHLLPESSIYLGWHIDTGQCHCTVEIFNNLTPPHKHWHGNKPSFCATTLFSQTNLVKLKIEFFYLTNNRLASYEAINHTEHS